jgi:hypothetical protein
LALKLNTKRYWENFLSVLSSIASEIKLCNISIKQLIAEACVRGKHTMAFSFVVSLLSWGGTESTVSEGIY